ncbi:unnamed protein product [Leptosia nina]|uniref:Peptidase S1 domain-containing protein n=1 Tax=Leptosia nina TaxID=320188 RepID=A0AAV1J0C2_9NEOP
MELFPILSVTGSPIAEPQYNVQDFFSSRIVGGIEAPPGYANYMVALVFGDLFRYVACGASIISSTHVLTAAHCIDPFVDFSGNLLPSFRGSLGSNYWESTQYIINFRGHINHPAWNRQTIKNDIGILFTRDEIKFNDVIGPIPLKFDHVEGSIKSFVTGWGDPWLHGPTPDALRLLYTSTITSKQCVADVRNASIHLGSAPPHDPAVEICALHSYGRGMCHGDSGSALVTFDSKEQIGIVSWGFPCARGAPDMFARVSAYIEWISDVMRNN